VVAEAAHRLGFALHTGQAVSVEALGLDDGEGDVAVELGVVCQVDALAAAFTEEATDFVAAATQRRRQNN
jgi:hypothetical protein